MKNQWYLKEAIKHFYFNKYLSVASLSLLINKSIPLTQKIIDELIDDGKITETGYAPSTVGRRAMQYSLKPGQQYIIAVAMDQFITKMVLIDLNNTFLTPVERYELDLSENEEALASLMMHIQNFIKKTKLIRKKVIGIGIGMPGFINPEKGLNYSFLPSGDKSICESIAEATGLPVFIDNDSSLIALAELRFGLAKTKKNALVINIGWGVGLGLILNSTLYRGDNGFAGEFSHISLFANNKLCDCGKKGCLETEASLLVIVEKAKHALNSKNTTRLTERIAEANLETAFKLIVKAAQGGDQFAIELISKAAYSIGRGVSILIHILNPEVIVLSGRGALAGKIWKAPMQQAVNEYTIPRLAAHTEIEISAITEQAELIGAAALVIENLNKEFIIKRSTDKYASVA